MKVDRFPAGPLGCNCSILFDDATRKALVVDPGGDFERIRDKLKALDADVVSIVHTHTHIDHVGATAPLQRFTNAPARIHEEDRFLYDLLPVQSAMLGIQTPEKVDMACDLVDDGGIRVGGFDVQVLHTPGHTPGSCTFYVRGQGDAPGYAFTGDTLFQQSIGRTDLWGGDFERIMKSIHERLLALPDDVVVVTGHGDDTTIGDERRSNPFLQRR